MRRPARFLALLLLLAFCAALLGGCGARKIGGQKLEKNTDYKPELYPYVVRTSSAVWYISQADLDEMGEEALYAGLELVLKDQEADFADARAALAGYLNEEVPPVMICTDFCGHANVSEIAAAYYNPLAGFIKVFYDWDLVRAALQHEYVHYLSLSCMPEPTQPGFWAEGLAEYVSRMVCANRMSHAVNMGTSEEGVAFYREKGAWDEERGALDETYLYYGLAEIFRTGRALGNEYNAVNGEIIERTEQIQDHPGPYTLSYYEAACMFAYLVETYGMDAVSAHWGEDARDMQALTGKSFEEVYADWALWNTARCAELGIDIDI